MKRFSIIACLIVLSSFLVGWDWPWEDERDFSGKYATEGNGIVVRFVKGQIALLDGTASENFRGKYYYEKIMDTITLSPSLEYVAEVGFLDPRTTTKFHFTILDKNTLRLDRITGKGVSKESDLLLYRAK
ncbi:hypothetical protein N9903_01335 [bacterium]|nr:hypothetical protein [bacterium]